MKENKKTFVDPEEVCSDIGQFRRRFKAFHHKTGELVKGKCAIADTFFSLPATTDTEHGYVTSRDDGELEFRPHTDQSETPAEYRKAYHKRCH
jgi:hypothetical protein